MPKLHDPAILIARARLDGAIAFFKKAQQDIYKLGQTDRRNWEGCLSELNDAREYIVLRAKGR